ncbi:MAG: VOC family protein, partial [Candidatus Thorarchaeota archaeon]
MTSKNGRITRLWLAMIGVSDINAAIEFYRDVLGLPVALDARGFGHAELGPAEPMSKIGLHKSERNFESVTKTGIVFETDDIF